MRTNIVLDDELVAQALKLTFKVGRLASAASAGFTFGIKHCEITTFTQQEE